MHLISPLISGIAGAGDGTAEIFRRGTSTPAALYSSFEGDPFASSDLDSNDRVILDSYGRKQVYVDEVCDVFVYDGDGNLQIRFTAGEAASAIEVRSASFTGNNYETGASAAGNPTTLQAVLDLWYGVQAARDWMVAAAVQPFIVVTDAAYGVVGNGVADDTAPLRAAIAAAVAAGGNSLFFPPGTYRVTDTLDLPGSSLTFVGCGSSVTTLRIDHPSANLIKMSSGALSIAGMSLRAAQANSGYLVELDVAASLPTLRLNQCSLGSSLSDGHLIHNNHGAILKLTDTAFSVGDGAASAIYCDASLGTGSVVSGCSFSGPSGAYTGSGLIYANALDVRGCSFDLSSVTSGTAACVAFNAAVVIGSVHESRFLGASGTAAAIGISLGALDASALFTETANIFPAATQYDTPSFKAYSYTAATMGKGVQLRTRDSRTIVISDNSASVAIPTDQYGIIVLQSTHLSAVMTGTKPPRGARGTVLFYHPSGGAGTAQPTTNFFGATAKATASDGTLVWEYVAMAAETSLQMFITVDGFDCGSPTP